MSDEAKMLLPKKYVCPICEGNFVSKAVKTGSARFVRTNLDLRPIYQNLEILKYDPVMCPACGYAALEKYFGGLSQVQMAQIRDKIAKDFKPRSSDAEVYTYDAALERYKLCLLSAMVKRANDSETGYICLKISWLLQSKADWLSENEPEKQKEIDACMIQEKNYAMNALECLEKARMEEDYPICGMNEPTLNYLLAALAYKADRLDFAIKTLSYVTSSREATERLKDKVYDLKALIAEKKKETEDTM